MAADLTVIERLVIVDGEPEWYYAGDPVVVEVDGLTYVFDWFEGCCVWTIGSGIQVTEDRTAVEWAGQCTWTRSA